MTCSQRVIALVALMLLQLLLLSVQLHTATAAASCPSAKCTCTNRRLQCSKLSRSDWLAMLRSSSESPDWLALSITDSSIGSSIDLQQVQTVAGSSVTDIALTQLGAITLQPGNASLKRVTSLDISGNKLQRLALCQLASAMPQLQRLQAADNELRQTIDAAGSKCSSSQLQELNISRNHLSQLNASFWRAVPQLLRLDASSNRIHTVMAAASGGAGQLLRTLLLGNNAFTNLSSGWLGEFVNLMTVDFSNSSHLTSIDYRFTQSLLRLQHLQQLRFDKCHQLARWVWGPALRRLVPSLRATSGWNCTCDAAWLQQLQQHTATCAWPVELRGSRITDVDFKRRMNCSSPEIVQFASTAHYGVGDIARLLCSVRAAPNAHIMWTTNRNVNISLSPFTVHSHASLSDTQSNIFHTEHKWHWQQHYHSKMAEATAAPRLQVLQDGSLYIDYVTRTDAGIYTCSADNGFGGVVRSEPLKFTLKYEVLREVKKYGIIVGAICAACLLGIGFTIGLIRLIVRKCSEEERKKKKSIKEMLEHLESYSGTKMEQFREYKVWFRSYRSNHPDGYNCRVNKMKDTCTTNMMQMQDNYNRRIAKIRDQCDSQMERLRESYNQQMSKIKDYRSNQVDWMREQYNQQLLRIKDYASSQLDRLRDQYKHQQAYFMKVMESLSIDNCMSGIPEDQLIEFRLDLSPDNSDSEEPVLQLPPLPPALAGDADEMDDFITATDRGGSRPQLDDFSDDDEKDERGDCGRGVDSDDNVNCSGGESLRSSQRSRMLQVEVLPASCPRSISSSLPQLLLHYDTETTGSSAIDDGEDADDEADSAGVVLRPASLQQQQPML